MTSPWADASEFTIKGVPVKATKTMIKAFALGAFVVALPFVAGLLGASAARAADVIFDSAEERKAIGVTNLEYLGTFYNVTFPEQMTAQEVYGDPPGLYPFGNLEDTQDAVQAIDDVLGSDHHDGSADTSDASRD